MRCESVGVPQIRRIYGTVVFQPQPSHPLDAHSIHPEYKSLLNVERVKGHQHFLLRSFVSKPEEIGGRIGWGLLQRQIIIESGTSASAFLNVVTQ